MPILSLLSGQALIHLRPVTVPPEVGTLLVPDGWVQTLDELFSRAATVGVEALDPAIWKHRSFGGSAHNGSSTWDNGAQTESTGTTVKIHSRNVNGAWKVDGFKKGIQNANPTGYGYDKGYLQFHARTQIRLSHAVAPGVGGYALFWQADDVWGSELDILETPGRIKERADTTVHWDGRGLYDLQTNNEQSTSEVIIDLTQWNVFDIARTFTFDSNGKPRATIKVAINGILIPSKTGWTDNEWLCKAMVPGYASYVAPDIAGIREWYGLPTSETPTDSWIEINYLKIWEPDAGTVPVTKSISFSPNNPGALTPVGSDSTVTWNTNIVTSGITNLTWSIVTGPPSYSFRTTTDVVTTGNFAISAVFVSSGEFVKAYETNNLQGTAVDSGAVTINAPASNKTISGSTAIFDPLNFNLSAADGFAAETTGCVGGAGGRQVTVTTGTALQAAINSMTGTPGPLIIYVDGILNVANSGTIVQYDIKARNNLSIIGLPGAELDGIGINITNASYDIIIRNLKIHHVAIGQKDAIGIQGASHHIWVDHCELYSTLNVDKDYYDGLLDTKAGSQYITISWCYFHDHWKASLNGSSDTDTGDRFVTYHHNVFENINSRAPLWRFGFGHIYNNVFINIDNCCNIRMGAQVRIENNHFIKVNNAVCSFYSTSIGYWDTRGNLLEQCTWSTPAAGDVVAGPDMIATCVYNPPYAYDIDPALSVKNFVTSNAGTNATHRAVPTTITSTGMTSVSYAVVNPAPNFSWAETSSSATTGTTTIFPKYTATGQFLKVFDTADVSFFQDFPAVTIT